MSIFPQTAALILKEHKHQPIFGDVLLIGRQTVLLSEEAALELIVSEGITPRSSYLREIDTTTVGYDIGPYITDRAFFSMFSATRTLALDVSAYEGAEIVHDLNTPLPDKYHVIAYIIFNGSCRDNLFDPATAIKSLSKMLRSGGRIIHLEHGTPIQDAFLCYSPEWFFNFYAINNYSDCQTLVCTFSEGLQQPWVVSRWRPYRETKAVGAALGIGNFLNVVIAQKGDESSDDRTPIQSHYRILQNDMSEDVYRYKSAEFDRNAREYASAPFEVRGQLPLPLSALPLWHRIGRRGLGQLAAISPLAYIVVRKLHRAIYRMMIARNFDQTPKP